MGVSGRFRRRWPARLGLALACIALTTGATSGASGERPPDRTLRVLASNPRYFTNGSGRAVYLTGSHVWWNLAGNATWDFCLRQPAAPFSYDAYLGDLARHGHNFIRLWAYELMRWDSCGTIASVDLHLWRRTGPGLALDGKPRFDLRQFNPAYFTRLRDRVRRAERRGIYVSVMLFEGWAVQFEEEGWGWRGNPFNPANNVNGIDADRNGDGSGREVHTLSVPAVTAVQDTYVRKVIDTVNPYDNVLYEIANESHLASIPWQYRMIDLVKSYERRKPKRHPVGMTYVHADFANTSLLKSRADWISPYGSDWLDQPPPADGRKVVLLDSDHLCGVCGGYDFVWKSFLRGHNPIYMDPFDSHPDRLAARRAMGAARKVARAVDLAKLRPRVELASTGYVLARPGVEYVVFQPGAEPFWLDVGRGGTYRGVWTNARDGRERPFGPRRLAGRAELTAPWREPAVLRLRRWTRPPR
ncbi:MAG: DUF6298 domain-containing protein [Actinomycetota bacterium]|nr:DUF6298 domain-containing protein [Actinomycetota bacterium]